MLALPVIAGVTLLKVVEALVDPPTETAIAAAIIGGVVAYGVGCASLWALLALVRRGHLAWFAPYCAMAGGTALFLLLR